MLWEQTALQIIITSTIKHDLKNWCYKERYHPLLYIDVNCSMEDIPLGTWFCGPFDCTRGFFIYFFIFIFRGPPRNCSSLWSFPSRNMLPSFSIWVFGLWQILPIPRFLKETFTHVSMLLNATINLYIITTYFSHFFPFYTVQCISWMYVPPYNFLKNYWTISQITAKHCWTISFKYWLKIQHRPFVFKLCVDNH